MKLIMHEFEKRLLVTTEIGGLDCSQLLATLQTSLPDIQIAIDGGDDDA